MYIYLLRHAIAVPRGTPGYPNDDRPLTDEGKKKMMEEAKALVKVMDGIDIILTSPLARAKETAAIAAQALQAESKMEICSKLQPEYSGKFVVQFLAKYNSYKKIMLVGHEPQMGMIASYLLGSEKGVIEIKKGSLCCIEVETLPLKKPGTLLWHLRPGHLRRIA
jgi:phosphohistidine phosphatase